jgi:hypothetical protein
MILQSEENKGVEFTGNGSLRLGCETNEERKVKSPTRKPDVWGTQMRFRNYRPGHPSLIT